MAIPHPHARLGLLLLLLLLSLLGAPPPSVAQSLDGSDAPANDNEDTPASDEEGAYGHLAARSYSELERRFSDLLEAYAAGAIPEEQLASKFAVFYRSSGLDSRFDEWIAIHPGSYAAHLARGIHRVSEAWRKRGSKFAAFTTDNQFQEFAETLQMAVTDLQASLNLYRKPVESYRYLIMASKGLGLGSGRDLLAAALKLDPAAYEPRVAYLEYLTPKWGGSIQQMEAFVEECKGSQLSDKDKARIEGLHYYYLGGHAWNNKQFKSASEFYLKAYETHNKPGWLYWSGMAAREGRLKELALERFDRLTVTHPKYQFGFTQRGLLYETHLKDDAKAFKDYLVAAELGNAWAQNRVGWWYMIGKYVPQNFDRATLFLKRAAAQNNATAIANLRNLSKLRKAHGR